MENVNVSVPNIQLSDLEKIVSKVKETTEADNTEISFEFIIASLFPTSWKKHSRRFEPSIYKRIYARSRR